MLYITIKRNGDEVEYTVKQNAGELNFFVNNKREIYDIMVDTAEDLGCLDKDSDFKSLEFKTMTENFATIIYNNSKQLHVYFDPKYDYDVLCIHGIGYKVTPEYLIMAFSLNNIVKDTI